MKSFWKKARVLPSGEIGVPESAIQQACENLLTVKHIDFLHVPDWSIPLVNRSGLSHVFKNWYTETFRGYPDLPFEIHIKGPFFLTTKAELKTKTGKAHGNKQRTELAAGRYALCRSLGDFQAVVAAAEALAEGMRA